MTLTDVKVKLYTLDGGHDMPMTLTVNEYAGRVVLRVDDLQGGPSVGFTLYFDELRCAWRAVDPRQTP